MREYGLWLPPDPEDTAITFAQYKSRKDYERMAEMNGGRVMVREVGPWLPARPTLMPQTLEEIEQQIALLHPDDSDG
jgi:hypothetical protein